MKREIKIMEPEILMEEYRQLLQERDDVLLPLTVSGNSMAPFLASGRDTVYLCRAKLPAHRGDILLYRRDNGAYVLHRVYSVTERGYTMIGDAQTVLEPGIRPDQILAGVPRVLRKGKVQEPGHFWWFFFERIWIRMVPLRRFARKCWDLLRKTGKTHSL